MPASLEKLHHAVSPPGKRQGREPFKREELLEYVRDKVVSGQWEPEALIPPRTWFEKKFDASSLTVQRAFEVLLNDGVLVANGRQGTRVSRVPPHLGRYGLVLYSTSKLESMFCRTLVRVANGLQEEKGCDIRVFFELNGSHETSDYPALLEAVRTRSLAGLFFAAQPYQLLETPILDDPTLPRVAIMGKTGRTAGVIPLTTGSDELYSRALRYIAGQNCRTLAILMSSSTMDPEVERGRELHLRASVEALNMHCPPEFYHVFQAGAPSFCASVVRLLFTGREANVPDSILVGDDNLLPHVITALRAMLGEERARRITLVSHGNYPLAQAHDFPVKYFMVNVRELLLRGFGIIDDLRSGRPPRSGDVAFYEE